MNKNVVWMLPCCILALLAVGCSAQPKESSVTEASDIAAETASAEAATEKETDESSEKETAETVAESDGSDTETVPQPETEMPVEDDALSDMAIDLTQKALASLKNLDTDGIIAYTNFPMLYYMTTGDDPETHMDDLRSRLEEGYPKDDSTGAFLFDVFDGTYTISRVEHSPALKEKFIDYIVKEQEEIEEGTSSRLERYPIEDVITVYGTMTYEDGNGDTGAVFLLNVNGEWVFDACYSFSMEMEGEWDGMLTD